MSKFFKKNESESEESEEDSDESSSEEESGSEEEESSEEESSEEEKKEEAKPDAKPKGALAFMKDGGDDSDSDADDRKREVKSGRDKKFDSIQDAVNELKAQRRDEEWVKVSTAFDNLNKLMSKAAVLIKKEGVPAFYYKALVELEADVERTLADKAAVKKLSKSNAKSLNSLKQNVRKVSKPYEAELAKLRAAKPAAKAGSDDDATTTATTTSCRRRSSRPRRRSRRSSRRRPRVARPGSPAGSRSRSTTRTRSTCASTICSRSAARRAPTRRTRSRC